MVVGIKEYYQSKKEIIVFSGADDIDWVRRLAILRADQEIRVAALVCDLKINPYRVYEFEESKGLDEDVICIDLVCADLTYLFIYRSPFEVFDKHWLISLVPITNQSDIQKWIDATVEIAK